MRIPAEALAAVNQKIGFSLFAKFGEQGVINLGKAVPIIGGVIGGPLNQTSSFGWLWDKRRVPGT